MKKFFTMLGIVFPILLTLLFADIGDVGWRTEIEGVKTYAMIPTVDSHFLIVGAKENTLYRAFPGSDLFIAKVDTAGSLIWSKSYDYWSPYERATDITQILADSGFLIVGTAQFAGDGYVYAVRIDNDGDTVWTKLYGGTAQDYAVDVEKTNTTDSGFVILAASRSYTAGLLDYYIIKIDSIGDTTWTKHYGGAQNDIPSDIVVTDSSGITLGYIFVGTSESKGAGLKDIWVLRTDTLGDTLWSGAYGLATYQEVGSQGIWAFDTGYYFVGSTNDSFGAGSWDIFVVKVDTLGDTIKTLRYGTTGVDYGVSIAENVTQTWDSGYVIVGYSDQFDTINYDYDVWVIKTDTAGDTTWTANYGDTLTYMSLKTNDYPAEVLYYTAAGDSSFIITGWNEYPSRNFTQIFIMQIVNDTF